MQKQTNEQENFPKKLIFYYFIDFSFEQKKKRLVCYRHYWFKEYVKLNENFH